MGTNLPAISDRPEITSPPPPPGSPAPHRKRRSYAGVWLLLLAGLGFGAYKLYENSQKEQQAAAAKQAQKAGNRPVSVVTALARSGDVPLYLRGLGTVTPFNSVTIKSRVDGQLKKIYFTEGQLVKQGDPLALIDPDPYAAQLHSAQGQLAKDEAQLKDAQVNLDRYQQLWKEQVIPKQQYDTQAATVGQFEGAIQADKAAIETANVQLAYTRINAPITGRVGLRLVDEGNIIHASDATGIVVVDQMQPISVLFTIPADSLPPVLQKLQNNIHSPVDAYDRDDRTKLASGSLLTVDNQIDPTTGTSRLKATFSNTHGELFPNQFVNCRLLLDTKHGATIVSAPAIQRGPQGNFVYVVTPQNTASARPVTIGTTEGDDVEIEQGLKPGETVVVEGQDKLQDGNKVDTRASTGTTGGRRGRGQQGGPQGVPPPVGQPKGAPQGSPQMQPQGRGNSGAPAPAGAPPGIQHGQGTTSTDGHRHGGRRTGQ